ncbi:MAG: DNA gyrase inhibitor YacG [Pirellulales bacterium]|nr:DNA gyrase inhibitor YacG [Pirellulales bacterium]
MSSSDFSGQSEARARRCPICGTMFLGGHSKALPFCSSRCRTIDLGRWLGEGYSVPSNPLDDELDSEEMGDTANDY